MSANQTVNRSSRRSALRAVVFSSALAGAAVLAACNDHVLPAPQHDAAFTLTATGASTVELSGTTMVLPVQQGGFRTTVNGRDYVRDLTPVVLVQTLASLSTSPQLSLNVLGPLTVGTLAVHRDGYAPSADSEVQARLIVPTGADLREHYLIDAGTITVTSLDPFVATFTLTGTQRMRMPMNPAVGQSFTSQPAAISVTGRIGAR